MKRDHFVHADELTGTEQDRGAVRKLVSEKTSLTVLLLSRHPTRTYRT